MENTTLSNILNHKDLPLVAGVGVGLYLVMKSPLLLLVVGGFLYLTRNNTVVSSVTNSLVNSAVTSSLFVAPANTPIRNGDGVLNY